MAKTYHAGIIPGDQAKKLYSYPTLSSSSDTLLLGSAQWAASDNVTVGTAKVAKQLSSSVDMAGYTFDGTQSMGRYVRCTTTANIAVKQVSDLPGFIASPGAWLILWLAYGNTALSPSLQIGSGTAFPLTENYGNGHQGFDDDASCRRLVTGAYLLVRTVANDNPSWMIVSAPAGFYRTATQSEAGFMSKFDKQAHDSMVSALSNTCTTQIDASGCMVVKLFGSNIPFIKIDKAGEW